MCSIPGLPPPGSNVSVHITKVNLNPLCVFVELWGNFDQEKKVTYQQLRKDIQFPRETFRELEGNPGDLCIVQVFETWYRARIVSRNGSNYNVFLIDEGRTLGATTSMLAWGQDEFFHLPPEVEFSILSNVLPLSPENRWTPMALEFLKALCGKTVTACIQDILVPHRTFLLDIPSISRQMYELGFAKKLPTEKFRLFVLRSLQSHSGVATSKESQQISLQNDPLDRYEEIEKQQSYMCPELQTETVETVIITEVTNPLRVFCQLKVFSQELKKLTEQITQHYEGRVSTGFIRPEILGSPCASRGRDGRWYRSVLQQIFPVNNVVEVLQIDYGKKQFVQAENIRPLAAEFFRMPVVTYVCSLHGIIDKGIGWTASQIDYLKSLLLNRTVIAKFEYQSLSEGVHYVTLYGNENVCINNLFGSKEKCLLESDASHGDYAVCSSNSATQPQHPVEESRGNGRPPLDDVKETGVKFPAEKLQLNSSHVAVVQHVSSPSKFWIQTRTYANVFDQLMHDIADMYSNRVGADEVEYPTVGLYCAAKASDDAFYRATVHEVTSRQVEVFFVDYGNTEMVEWYNLRVLPDRFKELPALALKCRLADIRPKDGKWSQDATVTFTKVVVDKILDVHVTAKCDGGYVVQLKDSSGDKEKDVSKLMCNAGFAVKNQESTEKLTPKVPSGPVVFPTTLNPVAISSTGHKTSGGVTTSSTGKERTAFKEHLFPIGSSVDVCVSFIESPNDFWCQPVQYAGHLNLLMQDMQAFYADSQSQSLVEAACVARHPVNGMWYRALVIQKHDAAYVDVLFIDYGQTKTVSINDLRNINPIFLKLKGQAFRCSLYNLIHPTSQTSFEWTEDAIAQFQNFVDTAASNQVFLKCTIYAVMFDAQKVVFNVVDLETPFESICSLMVQKGFANSAPAKKAPHSPFRLDTYYYSTHGIKTGTEEEVRVTSVKSVNHFYCQLQRNAETAEGLCKSVNALCHQLESSNCPQTFGTVCFAKYRDGQWYRGQIKSTQPSILVHFVDYGDMLEVDKSDLLPIPIEASEIMSLPVQAVECGLSDIPGDVSNEVNSWFETNMTDHTFRALVVAKEPNGKLLVELYDGKAQVNAKIKEKFHIKKVGRQGYDGKVRISQDASIIERQASKTVYSSIPKQAGPLEEGHQKRIPHLAPYRTPHQRQNENRGNGTATVEAGVQSTKPSAQTETKHFMTPKSPLRPPQNYVAPKAMEQTLPKLSDLPSKCIASGMEVDVFVSHCNSPWSFFVQLTKEEDYLFSFVEKLNGEQLSAETIEVQDLHEGDLVNAEFPEDLSWYRAVVRAMSGNGTALVEFIDFGNTATVLVSKMCRLDKRSLEPPRFSIHCMLNGAPTQEKKDDLNQEVVSKFRENVGANGDKELKCKFVKAFGSVWEVNLEDSGKRIACNTPSKGPATSSDLTPESTERLRVTEKPQQSFTTRDGGGQEVAPELCPLIKSLCYCKAEITEGQTIEAYASTITGPQSFWCQSADSDVLDKITEMVYEVGRAVEYKPVDADTLTTGSPCIALFTDDEQWYRAEIIRKEGDVLSVLFVDYGNESNVNLKDLRAMPDQLVDTSPQAFLCQLEGFDASQGSWDDSAADQLSELITEKPLRLSVLSVSTGEDGPTTCFVQVECEGQVVNEAMKVYWKSPNEDKPDATTESTHFDAASLPCESKLAIEKTTLTAPCLQEPSEKGQETVEVLAHRDDEHIQKNTYLASTVENTVCLGDLSQRSDTEPITDLHEDQDGDGSASVMEQSAISMDEAALYSDENREEISLSLSQEDIYEEVFHLPAALEGTETGPTALEELKIKDDSQVGVEELETLGGEPECIAEGLETEDVDEDNNPDAVPESEFGQKRAVEDISVGIPCAIQSPERNKGCKAKVLEICEDSVKVLLVDHDTEMVTENIFDTSSESEQSEQEDSADGLQQDQDDDPNDSEDTLVGDDPINAATEEMALLVDLEAEIVDPHQICDIGPAGPEQVQNELHLSEVCVPLGECNDVHAEQIVEIEDAATLEVVSNAPAQDKVEVHGAETPCPVEEDSALDTNALSGEQVVKAEAVEVDIVSSGLTQDNKDDAIAEETSALDGYCLAGAHEELEEGIEAEMSSCTTSTQDQDAALLEEGSSFEDDFESQLSNVTHLSLKVEDNSDEDLLVSQTRLTQH